MNRERISLDLFKILPKEQIERVFNQKHVDIEPAFLGFIHIYKNLSELIPEHFTVVDLGCAYNAQCFLFQNHKKYIAVDSSPKMIPFISDNCMFYAMSIRDFIENHLKDLFIDETFAICSFVPDQGDDNIKLAKANFRNIFTYYPHGGYKKPFKPL